MTEKREMARDLLKTLCNNCASCKVYITNKEIMVFCETETSLKRTKKVVEEYSYLIDIKVLPGFPDKPVGDRILL